MWSFVIQNIYGFVSIVFYITVSYLTVRERRFFNPSFVKLWILLAIVTFPYPSVLNIVLFLVYYLCYCQNITIFLVVLNRLRAIACPFSREAVWDNHFWLTVLVVLALPIYFCYDILNYGAMYKYKPQLRGYILTSAHEEARDELLQLTLFECVVTLLCLLVNICSIYMLCRKSMSCNYRRERNLFLISFLGFVFQTINSLVAAALYLFPPHSTGSTLVVPGWITVRRLAGGGAPTRRSDVIIWEERKRDIHETFIRSCCCYSYRFIEVDPANR